MTTRPEATVDLECFSNWFLVGITDSATGTEWDFQMIPGHPLDIAGITTLLQHYTIVTFNGIGYDLPMLMLALRGVDNATLKAANDEIITTGMKWWQFYRKYDCWPPEWVDHIDVSEVAPGVRLSLKQYMCRMHSRLVQDTPVDFNAPLPLEHAPDEIYYCRNDRSGTWELRQQVADRIDMRLRLSEQFGVDLRSKSDAQAAEAMVKAEWGRLMRDSVDRYQSMPEGDSRDLAVVGGDFPHLSVPQFDVDYKGVPRPIVPKYAHGTTFRVRVPDHVEFVTPYMKSVLDTVRNCDFVISDKDQAEMLGHDPTGIRTGVLIPQELKGRDITIGSSVYRMGIGGLHSQESSRAHRTTPGVNTLMTADVASYYPSLIINAGMNPPQLGSLFLSIYKGFYEDRLHAKNTVRQHPVGSPEYERLQTINNGYKIVLNGTFGKLFSRYSIFYAPEFGIAVTIGGQLSLLMLIERLELSGIPVISANTDGIEMSVPAGREWIAQGIMDWWQAATGLVLESHAYLALYSRDVNNYVSLQFDGSVKRTGVFGESGVLSGPQGRHPDCDICADAVVAFLTTGTPLAQTIHGCSDIRKFIRVRGAKGGAVWFRDAVDMIATVGEQKEIVSINGGTQGGEHLGRAVRWYYARDSRDYILDAGSLNKVAGSDGARPVMQLPDTLPTDIDYGWYVTRAEELLTDVGYQQ